MQGIWIAAVVTVTVTSIAVGGFVWAFGARHRSLLRFAALGLPLSAAVNLLVKQPLAVSVGDIAGIEPGQGAATPLWFLVFLFALAPVFEEPVKALPALLPAMKRRIDSRAAAVWAGMSLGLGFGLGEAIFLAYGVAASGEYATLPWYMFTGYMNERLLVTFLHGAMTAVLLAHAFDGHPLRGYLLAAGMHAFLNLGAMLYQLGIIGQALAGVSIILPAGLIVWAFDRVRPKRARTATPDTESAETIYFRRDGGEG